MKSIIRRRGLHLFLTFQCTRCKNSIETYTSNKCTGNKNSFDVNTRIVYRMRACGQGYAGLEKVSSLMNFLMPVTEINYEKIVKKLLCTRKLMQDACDDLHAAEDAETTSIVNTAASCVCDGSWHRRGHSSLNGVVTVDSYFNEEWESIRC